MLFPASGVEVSPLVPPLVAFVVSFFTSMGGVSGAFLLLPFQMSFLGYVAPSVSATNQLFNIVVAGRKLQQALGQRDQVQVYGSDYATRDGTCVRDYIHVEDLAAAEGVRRVTIVDRNVETAHQIANRLADQQAQVDVIELDADDRQVMPQGVVDVAR